MTLRKRHRKIWASLGIFATSLFLLVVALPLWLPWLLRPLAARSGASYAAYQREGYHRFVLQTLRYTNSSISFTADKVEAPVPTVWLWEVLVNRGTTAEPFLFASGWQLEIRSSQKDKSRPSQSTYTNVSSILRKLETFKKWVPVAV